MPTPRRDGRLPVLTTLLSLLVVVGACGGSSDDEGAGEPTPAATADVEPSPPAATPSPDEGPATPTAPPTPTVDPTVGPDRSRVHMVGDQLTDPSGDRLVLHGATLYTHPFYLNDGWLDFTLMLETRRIMEQLDPIFDRMAEVGSNTVRIPLGTPAWEQWLYPLTKDEWLERLDQVVSAAEERDMTVIVTWWDSLDLGPEWPQRHQESFEFMRVVHDRYSEDLHVLYEPWNEPHNITWEEWHDATASTVRFWREELDYRGVLILDTNGWSWSFDPLQADRILDLDRELLGEPNLMFAIHRYSNDNTCFCGPEFEAFQTETGQFVDSYPMVVTEVGNSNENRPPQPQWVDEFTTHLIDLVDDGLNGVLGFTWSWSDLNSMTEYDGVTLTEFGAQLLELLDDLP